MLNIAQIFCIAGQTMGGRKQKYNKIEPIIATLNCLLNVLLILFLVISLLNGSREMKTQFSYLKQYLLSKSDIFLVLKYFRQTQKVICIIHQISQTQLKHILLLFFFCTSQKLMPLIASKKL